MFDNTSSSSSSFWKEDYKIRERSQRRDREFPSTTAEEDHVRRWKKQTHISPSRCRKNTRQRGHKRETKRENAFFRTFSMAWSPYGIPADIIRVRFFCSTEKEQEQCNALREMKEVRSRLSFVSSFQKNIWNPKYIFFPSFSFVGQLRVFCVVWILCAQQ